MYLCVDKMQSVRIGNLCVGKIGSWNEVGGTYDLGESTATMGRSAGWEGGEG